MRTRRLAAQCAELSLFTCGLGLFAADAQLPPQSDCPRGALPAYSHNDYWNVHPLRDALSLGYQGAEADVFLVNGTLHLGHERRAAAEDGSFENLYLAPLRALVARCGTLTADGRPFLLTLEIKENSRPTFDTLVALLARYPDLFSPHGGQADTSANNAPPVHPVLVGWYPPGFADSVPVPLTRQAQLRGSRGPPKDAGDRDVGLISLDYAKTIGRRWQTPAQRRRWLSAIRATKAEHPTLPIRAYHVPVNERTYRDLLSAGVDLIGTLELAKTARILANVEIPDRKP